jgi:hypothetical protein
MGGGSSIIIPEKTVVYEISPGQASGYSFMRNTVDPLVFPAKLAEFKRGTLYILDYTTYSFLELSRQESLLQTTLLSLKMSAEK